MPGLGAGTPQQAMLAKDNFRNRGNCTVQAKLALCFFLNSGDKKSKKMIKARFTYVRRFPFITESGHTRYPLLGSSFPNPRIMRLTVWPYSELFENREQIYDEKKTEIWHIISVSWMHFR